MSQGLEILFFALVAGYLFYRLWSVLGQTPGEPEQRIRPVEVDDVPDNESNVVSLYPRAQNASVELLSEQASEGYEALVAKQPDFQLEEFLRGAMGAFRMVIQAFSEGDRQTLKQLLDASVFKQFGKALDNRDKRAESMESRVDELSVERVDEIRVSAKEVIITVRFASQQMLATVNAQGEIQDNPARLSVPMVDIWSFKRAFDAQDPNWVLCATKVEGE